MNETIGIEISSENMGKLHNVDDIVKYFSDRKDNSDFDMRKFQYVEDASKIYEKIKKNI